MASLPRPKDPRPPGLAYELHFPEGNRVRCYFNGQVEGVPPGTTIFNHASQYLYYLQAHHEIAFQAHKSLVEALTAPRNFSMTPSFFRFAALLLVINTIIARVAQMNVDAMSWNELGALASIPLCLWFAVEAWRRA